MLDQALVRVLSLPVYSEGPYIASNGCPVIHIQTLTQREMVCESAPHYYIVIGPVFLPTILRCICGKQ